jgi:hypothetical protein
MGEEAIGELVKRLSRPHGSGGRVIERSVILAEGSESRAILGWISDHDGVGESTLAPSRGGGLHGAHRQASVAAADAPARRFVLPAAAFD